MLDAKTAEPQGTQIVGSVGQMGKAILKMLAPSLQKRGVPSSCYIMVNILNDEYVTGKTRAQARKRFNSMHPGADGWMERFEDVTGEPDEPSVVSGNSDHTPSSFPYTSNARAGRRGIYRAFARREALELRPVDTSPPAQS